MHKGLWWGDVRKRDHLQEQGVEDNIKMNFQGVGWELELDLCGLR